MASHPCLRGQKPHFPPDLTRCFTESPSPHPQRLPEKSRFRNDFREQKTKLAQNMGGSDFLFAPNSFSGQKTWIFSTGEPPRCLSDGRLGDYQHYGSSAMDSALDGWISNGWWWMVVSTLLQEGWCMNRETWLFYLSFFQAKIMGCLQETLGF